MIEKTIEEKVIEAATWVLILMWASMGIEGMLTIVRLGL